MFRRKAARIHEFAGRDYKVRAQSPIRLGERSEPGPDLALLRFREDFYSESRPTLEDALLVVEVSETSSVYDREVKLPLYASSGVREAWIINLGSQAPSGRRCRARTSSNIGEATCRLTKCASFSFPSMKLLYPSSR